MPHKKFSDLWFVKFGLRRTMVLTVVLSVAVPAIVFFILQQRLSAEGQREVLAQAKADVMAMGLASVIEPMWAVDETTLRDVASKILINPQVVAVRIHEYRPGSTAIQLVRPNVKLLTAAETPDASSINIAHTLEEIRRGEEVLGTLHIWFDSAYGHELLDAQRFQMMVLVLVQVLLSMLVLMGLITYRILAPIELLKEQATALVSNVQSGSEVHWTRNDEIGQLGRHLGSVHNRLSDLFGELEVKNQQLQKAALYDALTGLCNRTLFHDLVDRELKQARRIDQKFGVLFIDLDHFKAINDSMGHDAGDAVLLEVSRRMRATFREVDVVCRQSGDEFLVMARDIEQWEQLGELAERLIKAIEVPMTVNNIAITLSASVGIALYPDDGDRFDTLVKEADIAMYQAKAMGRGRFSFFDSSLNANVLESLQLEHELGVAIRNNELILHYQPQVDAVSGKVVGVEALVRWQHPKRGLLYPGAFIGIAEESGKIADMGVWVLHAACKQLGDWRARRLDLGQMAVNVSALEFRDHRLLDSLQSALEKGGIDARSLDMEITESVLMDDTSISQQIIEHMRTLGVGIAIDDFGTGYSSLSYLKRLRPTQLKIDRSFVSDIESGEDSRAIVKGILGLASALGLIVVAEGVETETQKQFLSDAGCPVLQGYLISKPLSAHELERWLAHWQKS